MNEINDLANTNMETRDITDLTNSEYENYSVTDLVNIPLIVGPQGQQGPPGTPAKNYIIETTNRNIATEIKQNTNYEVPDYIVGTNSLVIYFEGNKLIKDENYIEVDETHIQFKDWNVPVDSNLEILIRKEEK